VQASVCVRRCSRKPGESKKGAQRPPRFEFSFPSPLGHATTDIMADDDLEEQVTCWVCFEVMEDPTTLGCSHSFCKVRDEDQTSFSPHTSLVSHPYCLFVPSYARTASLKSINETQIAPSAEDPSDCRFQTRTPTSSLSLSASRAQRPRRPTPTPYLLSNKMYDTICSLCSP